MTILVSDVAQALMAIGEKFSPEIAVEFIALLNKQGWTFNRKPTERDKKLSALEEAVLQILIDNSHKHNFGFIERTRFNTNFANFLVSYCLSEIPNYNIEDEKNAVINIVHHVAVLITTVYTEQTIPLHPVEKVSEQIFQLCNQYLKDSNFWIFNE